MLTMFKVIHVTQNFTNILCSNMRFSVNVSEKVILVPAILAAMVALERMVLTMKTHVQGVHHNICEEDATVLAA